MNTSFAEKVALITGGTSGIGRATAVAFAEQGANVVISGRREAEGAESLSLIQKAGGQGLFVRGDVSEESEIEALVAKTLERFGQLDFAFNNAGVGGEGPATMIATSDIYKSHHGHQCTRRLFFDETSDPGHSSIRRRRHREQRFGTRAAAER